MRVIDHLFGNLCVRYTIIDRIQGVITPRFMPHPFIFGQWFCVLAPRFAPADVVFCPG